MDKSLIPFSLPESWMFYVSTILAMLALAGLDFVGAIFAKEWAERGRLPMFILGWISFSVLFFVYARILKVAELSTVTIGWIVFLQVGLLVLDAVHYDVKMPWTKWTAIAVIIALQIYLIAAPNGSSASDADEKGSRPAGAGVSTAQERIVEPSGDSAPSIDPRRPSRPLGPNAA